MLNRYCEVRLTVKSQLHKRICWRFYMNQWAKDLDSALGKRSYSPVAMRVIKPMQNRNEQMVIGTTVVTTTNYGNVLSYISLQDKKRGRLISYFPNMDFDGEIYLRRMEDITQDRMIRLIRGWLYANLNYKKPHVCYTPDKVLHR